VEDHLTFHYCRSVSGTLALIVTALNGCTPAPPPAVYYVLDTAPDFVGVKVGCLTDPTFPAPMISGFEEYRFPWSMNVAAVRM
jgi:hypothetical protein